MSVNRSHKSDDNLVMSLTAPAVIILILSALFLSGCGVPQWVYDPGTGEEESTAEAYPPVMEIGVTGTPIDAVAYASPTPLGALQTPESVTPPPDLTIDTAAIPETAAEICENPASGEGLTYDQAFAIAADSPCTDEGELLPAHTCHEGTGSWWIGLNAPRTGCNPACVVSADGQSAEINWRCTEPASSSTPEQPLEKFSSWRGRIERQPQGSQVEYRFYHDDGRWFNVDSRDNNIRQQFAVAAWTASNVILSGEINSVPNSLTIEDLTLLLTKNTESRDLSPFAMASSSSQLAADEGGIYFATALVDGLAGQPWCEGVEGEGIGEWIQLDFTSPVEITSLHLTNGYQGQAYLYDINGRVKTLALFVDGELVDNWDLVDSTEQQSYNFAGDVVPGIVANSLKLVIEETYPGWEFEDTCIGEIEVWGRPAG